MRIPAMAGDISVTGAWVVVIGFCAVGAVLDARSRRIPNRLTGPALLGGLVWAAWTGGFAGLGNALLASVLLALPFIVLFVTGSGGAGDAKLMAAVGSWLGLFQGVVVLLCVLLAGGVLGLLFAFARRKGPEVLANIGWMGYALLLAFTRRVSWRGLTAMPQTQMLSMPYGLAIFAGACMAAGGVFVWGL